MNSRFRARLARFAGRRWKALVISVVILFEVAAIAIVATNAWVETVSSIKITNEANTKLEVDSYVYTDVTIGSSQGTIDLAKYFKQAGDMHLAPASSADGVNLYFPKAGDSSVYRKGDTSDMNTSYLSVTFRLKADTNADFFFTTNPDINVDNNIRVSVTAYTEGTTSGDLYDSDGKPLYTKIYANSKSAQGATVVNSTSGSTGATSVEAFSAHKKGTGTENRLFAVGANETKIVTINIWLQKVSTDMDSVMSDSQAITNLGITSSPTPRHVTLIPTPTWDISSAQNQTFYAWCWMSTNDSNHALYKLTSDSNEHYSFDYNGTYDRTLFFRSGNTDLTTESMTANNKAAWSNGTIWNKTEDTSIPNDPVDPTFIIETINGSTEIDNSSGNNSTAKKSTGSWHDPATVKIAYATGSSSSCGTIKATSYVGTETSSHVIESTNSSSQKHTDTVHAWPGKILELEATANTDYAFVGWYTDAACTTAASGSYTSTTYTPNAPSTASEVTYYARFTTDSFNVTANAYYSTNGGSSYSAGNTGGTVKAGSSAAGATSTESVRYMSSVSFVASAASGYEFVGWYNAGGTQLSTNTTYTYTLDTTGAKDFYARFNKVSIYLTGWLNGAAVTSGQNTLEFTQSSAGSTTYTLTYEFTGNQDGYQYPTVYFSEGNVAYHPENHESGSGVAAHSTNTSPNDDPKWKVNATSHDSVTFTWDNSTHTLSWTITKYYYFDVGDCSWFKNDGCVPGVSYNYGAYQAATHVSGNIYRIAIPEDVTKFSLSRHNSNGDYNAFNVTKSGTDNRYNINSNCNGGSWTTY